MHRALALPEVLRLIVHQQNGISDKRDILALTRVSHAFSESALDLLWEAPPLWSLAVLMDACLWRETVEHRVKRDEWNGDQLIDLHTMVSASVYSTPWRSSYACTGRHSLVLRMRWIISILVHALLAMRSGYAEC
jgi:hypothetical protein